ncbi:MAG: hypothetical protein MJ191_06940 [Clostridium sp.]|nr:hypothetical protein [Clostridium sp.]
MTINKEYFKKNFNFIICLITSIIVTSTCVILLNINTNLKGTSTSNNISTYALIANNLNSVNSSLNNCIADTSLNIDSASYLLKSGIAEINNCITSLNNLSSNDNIKLSTKLLKALDNTYDLYTYYLNYISTYEDSSLDELITNLDTLKSKCVDSYSTLYDEGISLDYNDSLENFSYAFVSHYSKLNQIKIQGEIKNAQYTEFITKLSDISDNFFKLLENLKPAIERIHEENRNFDVLLNDLNEKEDSFNSLKKDLCSISIPEGSLNYYNNLNDIFSLYSSYLDSIRTAIIYELSSSGYKENKKVIDKNYNSAYEKYNNLSTRIQQFLSLLENS